MGRSCFSRALLVLALLVLTFSHGFGGEVMEAVEDGDSSSVQVEESAGKSREMVQLMDYNLEPGPNTNPHNGYIYTPPPRG